MSSKVFNLLSDLAQDTNKRDRFNENPEVVLDEYGIDQDMKTLLTSGKWEDFQQAVHKEAEAYGMKAP
ncbi:MAG: hypothetical protein RID53_24810 [Coleofasciculus sp. B1-GNL1-01]|uniref:hypothetical protein n=1 Tax=Coleofasciculus sp. B1-GNL1-01 TaxID=3068484 RepID=UPI0032F79488